MKKFLFVSGILATLMFPIFIIFHKLSQINPTNKFQSTGQTDNCQVKPGRVHQFKFIPLLSFPGSGNTWLRKLVEDATGYQTTTVERGDKQLAKHFIGEQDHPHRGRSIIVKTHWFGYIQQWYKRHQIKNNREKITKFDTYKDARHCIFLMRQPIAFSS